MKQINKYITAFFSHRWIQYLLFWGIVYYFLARHFSYDGNIEEIDAIYTGLFLSSICIAVVLNSFVLIPHYLAKSRYVIYSLLMVAVLAITTWFNIFTFQYLSRWIFPEYYFISYYSWDQVLQFIIAALCITSLLQLSRSWFREAEIKQSMAELEQQKIKTELKALRAQINPHFLFNSLNHIYALASKKSDQTAPAVLQLSQLLRYSIQNMDKEKVPLSDEIEYLKEFISFYQNRIHHPERIKVDIENNSDNLKIAPMLLIVFVENCFKHGSVTQEGEKICIDLSLNGNRLILKTQNNVDERRELPESSTELGLENVKRRLALLYSGKHTLNIDQNNGLFNVNLQLDLA